MNMETITVGRAPPGRTAWRRLLRRSCGALALLALPALAGNFGVSPIGLDLDRTAKSGAITVSNEDTEPLRVQIRLFEWIQSASGKDEYRESEDLIYFPKLMTIEANQQKLVRVGLRIPAGAQEKAYRLFVEELPAAQAPGSPAGAQVAMKVRFGVPIFLKPAVPEARGEIQAIEMAKGKLRVSVRNTGNVHFTINEIAVSGGGSYAEKIAGWYLLPGTLRDYVIPVPPAACRKLGRIDVTARTEHFELKTALDVTASMCGS